MNTAVSTVRSQASDFVELCKPRITLLVLISTFTGMFLAAGDTLSLSLVVVTLVGTAMASAASGALNNFIDRDIDKDMGRTRSRALPSGRVLPQHALILGLLLSLGAFLLLFFAVNPLTAFLALATILFYVGIYTAWLKRHSPLCTEIGGIAGALPPIIGWAAVTNGIGAPALALFLLMFLWQPPHFWVLALLRTEEYRRVNIPMLPVVSGQAATKQRILLYTITLLPATWLLYSLDVVGLWYLVLGSGFGLAYLALTIEFVRKPLSVARARRLFGFSILYLFSMFIIILADFRVGVGY